MLKSTYFFILNKQRLLFVNTEKINEIAYSLGFDTNILINYLNKERYGPIGCDFVFNLKKNH
jgi:hypothetical protein